MPSPTTVLEPERVAFLQGLLVALASCGQIIDYEELRKLSRCPQEHFTAYLEAARAPLQESRQPDVCAIVITGAGLPAGFRDLEVWEDELEQVHTYWVDVRNLTPEEFTAAHGSLPALPIE
jgi:hypothetical protein